MGYLTVNQLMVLMNKVRERISEFRSLRNQLSTKETYYSSGEIVKQIEPQYDFKSLDRKIMELENFLFQADSSIKQSNARVKIKIDADVDGLLAPLS